MDLGHLGPVRDGFTVAGNTGLVGGDHRGIPEDHRDDLSVPTGDGTVKMPGVSGSASLKDGRLAITLTNPSLDAALEWAARCPAASYGAVEVRPIAGEVHKRVTGEYPNR